MSTLAAQVWTIAGTVGAACALACLYALARRFDREAAEQDLILEARRLREEYERRAAFAAGMLELEEDGIQYGEYDFLDAAPRDAA